MAIIHFPRCATNMEGDEGIICILIPVARSPFHPQGHLHMWGPILMFAVCSVPLVAVVQTKVAPLGLDDITSM